MRVEGRRTLLILSARFVASRYVSATLLSAQGWQTSRLLGVGGELPNQSRPPAARRRVVGSDGRAGPFGSETLRGEEHRLSNGFVHQDGTRMGGSRCEARARRAQPEIRWPLAGKRVAVPVGTGSLPRREATERTRGDSLVSDGHDFDSRSAV